MTVLLHENRYNSMKGKDYNKINTSFPVTVSKIQSRKMHQHIILVNYVLP